MKYNIKRNKNISLIVILLYILVSCILFLLNVDVFSAKLLLIIFLCISSIIILGKLINNIRFCVFLYDDHLYIKNKSKELVIKLTDITKIDIWLIIKEKYIVIYYKDDNQIQLDFLKKFYVDINTKLKKIKQIIE